MNEHVSKDPVVVTKIIDQLPDNEHWLSYAANRMLHVEFPVELQKYKENAKMKKKFENWWSHFMFTQRERRGLTLAQQQAGLKPISTAKKGTQAKRTPAKGGASSKHTPAKANDISPTTRAYLDTCNNVTKLLGEGTSALKEVAGSIAKNCEMIGDGNHVLKEETKALKDAIDEIGKNNEGLRKTNNSIVEAILARERNNEM